MLKSALDLSFPAGAKGLQIETQLQYASLLQAANRLDQASSLYRQVLAADVSNTQAWQGLVRVQHAMKQDPQALDRRYTHYNLLRTIEDNFGLEPLTVNDRNAKPITDIWK